MSDVINILMVDDRPENLLSLEAILNDPDYRLVKALSGDEALGHLLNTNFVVILLDVNMPGMDGFQTAELIRSRDSSSQIPIIFITAVNQDNADVLRGYSIGAVDYVFKPILPEVLRAKVGVYVSLFRKTKELERSNRDLEEFAYVASHDLRQPLRMVSNFMKLIQQRYKGALDENADKWIDSAVAGSNRMGEMIDNLLDYSRVGTKGKPFEKIESESLLKQALMNLGVAVQESGAQVTYDALPIVTVDKSQIIRLFQNLIDNAIKFCGDKSPRIHISAKRAGTEWVFSIRDNGIGIDPQFADRIFVIFQRLHAASEYPGSGIGLSVSRRIVERHGGRIWVESQPGKGATFFYSLPIRGEVDE